MANNDATYNLNNFGQKKETGAVDPNRKLRVAIIGTGWIAESHVQVYKNIIQSIYTVSEIVLFFKNSCKNPRDVVYLLCNTAVLKKGKHEQGPYSGKTEQRAVEILPAAFRKYSFPANV